MGQVAGKRLDISNSAMGENIMKRTTYARIILLLTVVTAGSPLAGATLDQAALPGRQVKVAAIAIGFGGNHDEKLRLAIEHLETAGGQGVDIACLPEEFAGTGAETIPGPTTAAVAEMAKKHHMYVVCPIREQSADGRQYNTAVLLNRAGQVQGCYRKIFVYWGEGLNVSRDGVAAFDTDFGRIAILTCFDANFDEVWQEAERKGAEIVFWPSAYGGGSPLNGYAMIHNYYVVAVGQGNIIDVFGKNLDNRKNPREHQFIATLDLDRTLVHTNFNTEKVAKLLKEHQGEVIQEQFLDMESWYVLRSVKPGVRVRNLCKQYQIETLREYRQRSRAANQRRSRKGQEDLECIRDRNPSRLKSTTPRPIAQTTQADRTKNLSRNRHGSPPRLENAGAAHGSGIGNIPRGRESR